VTHRSARQGGHALGVRVRHAHRGDGGDQLGCRTVPALVGRDGSIDWLCWPRFDSPACFAALLGEAVNGRWIIAPTASDFSVIRRYRPDTLVLETEFAAAAGRATIIDFMPHGGSHLVRIVLGKSPQRSLRRTRECSKITDPASARGLVRRAVLQISDRGLCRLSVMRRVAHRG
jgi:hypothetical protein